MSGEFKKDISASCKGESSCSLTHTQSLTDHMENGGRHQVAALISDLIHPIMLCTQPGDDHLVDSPVSPQREEAPVPGVLVHNLAIPDQLHGARVPGLKGHVGGVGEVQGRGKNELDMRDREKKGKV